MMKRQQKLKKSSEFSHFHQKVPISGQKMLILGPKLESIFPDYQIRLVLTKFTFFH